MQAVADTVVIDNKHDDLDDLGAAADGEVDATYVMMPRSRCQMQIVGQWQQYTRECVGDLVMHFGSHHKPCHDDDDVVVGKTCK